MRVVLIAATLAAIAAPASAGISTLIRPSSPLLDQQRTQEACASLAEKTAYEAGARLKRLDQLPWGLLEHTVLRSVDGCPVREVVYQGQTYWVPGTAPQVGRATPGILRRPTRK